MLSRVANSLYWMFRYIERAENIARIVDVNLQLLLDLRDLNEQRLAEHWLPIVQTTGGEGTVFRRSTQRRRRKTSPSFWSSSWKTPIPSSPPFVRRAKMPAWFATRSPLNCGRN